MPMRRLVWHFSHLPPRIINIFTRRIVHALSSTLVGRELNFWSLSGWIENPRRALAQRARSGCRASHKRKAARGRALHKVHFNVHMSPTVHFTSKITHINPSRQSNDSGGRKATRWGQLPQRNEKTAAAMQIQLRRQGFRRRQCVTATWPSALSRPYPPASELTRAQYAVAVQWHRRPSPRPLSQQPSRRISLCDRLSSPLYRDQASVNDALFFCAC
jgi:hypothetical protein